MGAQGDGQAFACSCGKVAGHVAPAGPRFGAHVICYCVDCRAAAMHLGAEGALTDDGGMPLYQTRPDWIHFDQGKEHLACLRLSPKGLLRWYAACCNTPLANSLPTPKVPFASLSTTVFADPEALGPIMARINTVSAKPGSGAPKRDNGFPRAILAFMRRAVGAFVSGKAKVTPFFDAQGQPVAAPHVITKEQRQRASA